MSNIDGDRVRLSWERSCTCCGTVFWTTGDAKFCSFRCRSLQRYGSNYWSPEEIRYLYGLAAPAHQHAGSAVSDFRDNWAGRSRSREEIKEKLRGLSAREMAELIGVPLEQIKYWVRAGFLRSRLKKGHHIIQIKDVLKTIKDCPGRFAKADPDVIRLLFGAAIAQQIQDAPPVTPGRSRRIRNVETGEIFASAREVGQRYFICPSVIGRAARTGTRSLDQHWEYADQ